jgi:ABC-2 type transport system ATP-binding protein
MIRVSGLTKDYGNRRAIDNLNFNIEKGEIVGFLGPNGAGKTTTMRILSGFLPPTYGKVEIGGFDILENSLDVRKIVGYLPESVPLYSDMTLYDYLKYMADLRHIKNAEDRVYEVLELVHMDDRAEGYISNLSKGMKQRVGLAQALIHRPEVLVLDEPTIGLDPAQNVEVRNLIREIGKEHTVLLSTHILSEAQQICNRVLIINKGQIVAEDTTEHLQSRLTGSQRVKLRIRGDGESAVAKISKISGVLEAILKLENVIEFEAINADEISPKVAKTLIQSDFDLLELQPASMSLEEIFLQLTHEEPVAEASGEEMENNA